MSQTRMMLQADLESIRGVKKVYFDPPAGIHMEYPCIVYNYTNDITLYADNQIYLGNRRYTITVIDENPDSRIPLEIMRFPHCSSDRNFKSDGLNHFVFTLFY